MPKNIVILCDGTSNEIASNRSNILRLFGTLEKSERQIVFYDPGVGTFGAENAWSRLYRKAIEIWGLVTGWGVDQNVKEAYRFIIDNYTGRTDDDPERDRIYIFGFSRGAYTARVLAGFIHAVGLIDRTNLNLLDYAYRAYKRVSDRTSEPGNAGSEAFAEVRLYERMLRPDRPPIRCLGLFDTVASVIEWGRFGPRLRSHAFTRANTSVEAVRHAVAIDERRTMFQPQLWPSGGEYRDNPFNRDAAKAQDSVELWFTGVHGDVGGGYPEAASALAKIPLDWMIAETRDMGLHYIPRTVNELVLGQNTAKHYVPPDPFAERNESMNRVWAMLEFLPRRSRKGETGGRRSLMGFYVPFFERRQIPPGAAVHRSVIERAARQGGRLPENVPPDHETWG